MAAGLLTGPGGSVIIRATEERRRTRSARYDQETKPVDRLVAARRSTRIWGYVGQYPKGKDQAYHKTQDLRPAYVSHPHHLPSPSQSPLWAEHPSGYSFLRSLAPSLPPQTLRWFVSGFWAQKVGQPLSCSDALPAPFGVNPSYQSRAVCQGPPKKTAAASKFLLTPFPPVWYTIPCAESALTFVCRAARPGWGRTVLGKRRPRALKRGGRNMDRRCLKHGNETYLSAQEAPWPEGPRLPQAHGHRQRPQGPGPPPRQGPRPPLLLRSRRPLNTSPDRGGWNCADSSVPCTGSPAWGG